MSKYSGPQYLGTNGHPIKYRPDDSHFSDSLKNVKMPNFDGPKRQFSPKTAKTIAQAMRILLKTD